ncbi:MAG: signal peptidase II [Myxococcota bacterium]|nr:signal peptidase II [Myxococcota bacterium]
MSKHRRTFFILVPLLVFADQLTKILVRSHVQKRSPRRRWMSVSEAWESIGEGKQTESISVIDNFFTICHTENTGAAFGLLSGHEHRMLFFTVVTLLAFVMILYYFRQLRPDDGLLAISLSTIFAGAAGNFIDRLLFQKVTDFLLFYIPRETGLGQWLIDTVRTNQWPAFNIADMCINIGVGIFIWHVLFIEPKRKPPEDEADSAARSG